MPEAVEIATDGTGGLWCSASRMPESHRGFPGARPLLEDEFIRLLRPACGELGEAVHEVADTEQASAVFALRPTDLLAPDALLNFDCPRPQIEAPPLQTERFVHCGR